MIGEIDLIRKHSGRSNNLHNFSLKKNARITKRNASDRKIKNQLCANTLHSLHCYNQVEDKKSLGLPGGVLPIPPRSPIGPRYSVESLV